MTANPAWFCWTNSRRPGQAGLRFGCDVVLNYSCRSYRSDVWEGLLNPFEKGEWNDKASSKFERSGPRRIRFCTQRKREGRPIDCTKTIWILTTNALDDDILGFMASSPTALKAT